MNKRNIVISIIIFLAILLGMLVGFYFYIKNKDSKTPIDPNSQNVSFFGTSSPKNISVPNIPGQNNPATTTPSTTTLNYFTPASWRLVWEKPVSLFGFVYNETRSTSTTNRTNTLTEEKIRFGDRETGNIFQTATSTILIERLSNTTYPRVEDGFFANIGGKNMVLRRLSTKGDLIETSFGSLETLTTTSTSQSLNTKDISKDFLFTALSPNKTLLAHITNNPEERLITTKLDGSGKVILWSSPLKEFIPYWVNNDSIILHSKASAFSPSYIFVINPVTKTIKKLPVGAAGRRGFTTAVRSDLKKAVISYLDNTGNIITSIRNIDSSDESPLYISTLAEKCVWSKKNIDVLFCAAPETAPRGNYPDLWYQGNVVFQDNLWQIDIKTGASRLVFRPLDYMTNGLDIQKIELSRSEDYLIFQDKRTLSLWGLEINVQAPTSTKRVR